MTSDLMLLKRHTDLLLATCATLPDGDAPSLCQGWTRSHVLAHLARNADGLSALVRAAVDGTGETMYAGDAARDADIEAGARLPLSELTADVRRSAEELQVGLARLRSVDPTTRVERTPGGHTFTAGSLAGLRLREVIYHHVDLASDFTFADVEPELLLAFHADEYARLGAEAANRARAADLLWLARGIRQA